MWSQMDAKKKRLLRRKEDKAYPYSKNKARMLMIYDTFKTIKRIL